MKVFKEIFCRIWCLWALVLFVPTMFIALPFYLCCYIIKEPAAAHWHRKVSKVWMTFFLNLIACPLKVVSAEYFKKGENYIVACNHNSLMDIPITTPFMPQANKTIAKTTFAFIPVFGWIYAAGSILVNRKNEQSRRDSFRKMKWVLRTGLDMVIYPEGTRNRTNDPLKSFYDGAFKLAVDTGKPIMPALLFNTRKVLPAEKIFYLEPHKMEMHFLPPVESTGITAKQLKEKVFRQMWDYYEANK
ncbi:1-acyl-sn-glycerol-3-phosphate acyltransferase [Panacibacter ginsenosidivorans]|uniref:1-acyl-sn-glycerol-3-phosphate acyltransferase n=2 Tax=Panacibacter ginsenosidivorans TaxID=1813871 RepID=A0A5B8VH36_9BACT|nr:1-acyl-sn-glycerol-3-phosphate acyltransferase [Panacibacter ginsenosidivorans]